MTIEPPREDAETGFNRRLTVILLRVCSLVLFALGLSYWALIVGLGSPLPSLVAPLPRFDLMTTAWKVAAPTLAVLYPVGGVGLWMTARWGPVVWGLILLVECIMQFAFAPLFGDRMTIIVLHGWGFLMLGLLRAVVWRGKRSGHGPRARGQLRG